MKDFILVYITCPTRKSAEELAQSLLDKRLIACANIIPGLVSFYYWQGNIESDNEVLMLLKTRAELFDSLCSVVTHEHPYDVPEIIATPIVKGSAEYLDWIRKETENGEGMT